MCIEGTEKMDADDARKYFFVFGIRFGLMSLKLLFVSFFFTLSGTTVTIVDIFSCYQVPWVHEGVNIFCFCEHHVRDIWGLCS